jgi:hypothetical protein
VVTAAPGDQTAPAVAGSAVVWQETGQSCPTCEADIRGKDLVTGNELVIASGPADQSAPAIAGRSVAWLEQAAGRQRLLTTEIGSQVVTEVATAGSDVTFGRPAMSDDLIVWSEQRRDDRAVHQTLRAYRRATGATLLLAETT